MLSKGGYLFCRRKCEMLRWRCCLRTNLRCGGSGWLILGMGAHWQLIVKARHDHNLLVRHRGYYVSHHDSAQFFRSSADVIFIKSPIVANMIQIYCNVYPLDARWPSRRGRIVTRNNSEIIKRLRAICSYEGFQRHTFIFLGCLLAIWLRDKKQTFWGSGRNLLAIFYFKGQKCSSFAYVKL